MGPRLFRRGNLDRPSKQIHAVQLQWGHVFSDVEMRSRRKGPLCPYATLQWGHVFSDVEIHTQPYLSPDRLSCFNGATSFQTWKWRPRGVSPRRALELYFRALREKSQPRLSKGLRREAKEASGAGREVPGFPPPPRLSQRGFPIVKDLQITTAPCSAGA